MTRPTDEQIKALRKGDVVTVRATLERSEIDNDGDWRIRLLLKDGRGIEAFCAPSEIMTIEPREIKVGDRVREGFYEGEVKCICDDTAFVRYDTVYGKEKPVFFCNEKLSQLERLP